MNAEVGRLLDVAEKPHSCGGQLRVRIVGPDAPRLICPGCGPVAAPPPPRPVYGRSWPPGFDHDEDVETATVCHACGAWFFDGEDGWGNAECMECGSPDVEDVFA